MLFDRAPKVRPQTCHHSLSVSVETLEFPPPGHGVNRYGKRPETECDRWAHPAAQFASANEAMFLTAC